MWVRRYLRVYNPAMAAGMMPQVTELPLLAQHLSLPQLLKVYVSGRCARVFVLYAAAALLMCGV